MGFARSATRPTRTAKNGNRDGSQTRLGATGTWTVDINNRVTFDGEYNYTYDAEGNLTWKYKTGEYIEYIYDHRNRLARVAFRTASSGSTWQDVYYRYDYQNRMIRRLFDADGTAGGAGTTNRMYIHDGMQIVQIFDRPSSTVNLTDRLLWTDQVDYLVSDERVSSLGSAGTVYWSLPNHLGTVVDVATYNSGTDTTTIAKHRGFDSFGNITSDSASGVIIVMGYTGKFLEATTGLQNNINRWYAAWLGEWMTEDPSGLGPDENPRRYVNNAPTFATDPTGLESPTWSGRRNQGNPTGFWDSLSSSWHGMQMTYTSLILEYAMNRPDLAREAMREAYECGPLAQTANPTGGPVERAVYYYGTRGALTVSTAATAAAGTVMSIQLFTGHTVSLTFVPIRGQFLRHVGWQAGGRWFHASFNNAGLPGLIARAWPSAARMGAGGYWNTITGIPIINPTAATGFSGITSNCLVGALRAIGNGWTWWSLVGISIYVPDANGAESNNSGPGILPTGGGGGGRNGPTFLP